MDERAEIELALDGDGLAVMGRAADVERFLTANGWEGREIDVSRVASIASRLGSAVQAASVIAQNSGRWVKLSEESARRVQELGLRASSSSGLATGVLRGDHGRIAGFVEFVSTPGALLSNPLALASIGGMMSQFAMQRQMDAILEYLEVIDAKIDDLLRTQKDGVVADMLGAALIIDDAYAVRDGVGRVSDVTWSKVQATAQTLARTQAYALRQIDALTARIPVEKGVTEVLRATRDVEAEVREWLVVLARCVHLTDALAVLELDRVMDTNPTEVDAHRAALSRARATRSEVIGRSTMHLIARVAESGQTANRRVLVNPFDSPELVKVSNSIARAVGELRDVLELPTDPAELEARRWLAAAADARDVVIAAGTEGVEAAHRIGGQAAASARDAADSVLGNVAEGAARLRGRLGARAGDAGLSSLPAPDPDVRGAD